MRIDKEQVADVISHAWDWERVILSGDGDIATARSSYRLCHMLPSVLSWFCTTETEQKENRQSIQNLYDTFGEWRIQEISKRWDLDIPKKKRDGSPLSASDVRTIFAAIGDVRIEDLKHIFSDITYRTADYLEISDAELEEIREQFSGRTFEELHKDDFGLLHALAVPFENISTLFCHSLPRTFDEELPSVWAGALDMMKWRVQHIEEMRRAKFDFPDFAESIRKAKRVYNYFMPTGVVIPHSDGYTYVYGLVHEHGCYKFFHKSMNKEDRPNMVSYLGTQLTSLTVPRGFETIKIDLHPNIGAPGVIDTYDETKALLTRPVMGFVDSDDEKVDLFGFSLGGALGGYDLCLFTDRINSATFVSTPGLDIPSLNLLAERVNTLADSIDVTLIWDVDDHIRLCGEGHLGLFADPEKLRVRTVFMLPEDGVGELPHRPASPLETMHVIYEIFSALTGAHVRETSVRHFVSGSEQKYSVVALSSWEDRDIVSAILDNRPLGWEKVRREIFGWTGDENEFINFWRGKLSVTVPERAMAVFYGEELSA